MASITRSGYLRQYRVTRAEYLRLLLWDTLRWSA